MAVFSIQRPRHRVIVIAAVLVIAIVASLIAVLTARGAATPLLSRTLRATYHLTPPSGWMSDPQRPVYANGKYNLYYLDSPDTNGAGYWERATTTDNVVFTDQGIAIPYQDQQPVWTGSSVVDTNNTAGFGANAIVALATQPGDDDAFAQAQYLWYSTDNGATFTKYGAPVIQNTTGTDWNRDPKIAWDGTQWVVVIGHSGSFEFRTSPNLKTWSSPVTIALSSLPSLGSGVTGVECPDLFTMKADDGTTHWVLGAGLGGNGKIFSYGYWTGSWDGAKFVSDGKPAQWLDSGWDWYAAVTWPDNTAPDTSRYAIGWINNWNYAKHGQPTSLTDSYNGQMSLVRKLSFKSEGSGVYTLLSQPAPALANYTTKVQSIPTTTVPTSSTVELGYHGSAYELETDVSWTSLNNVGISVGRSGDGSRHTNVGIFQGPGTPSNYIYVDRSAQDQTPYTFFGNNQATATFGTASTAHLKIFVDRGSVEVFVNDGATVLTSGDFFLPTDTGISLYTDGGAATFTNMKISEFQDITRVATTNPASAYANFEGSTYGTGWATTGTAFGSGPVAGTLAGQSTVSGYTGTKLVNSYLGGDGATGTLTSPSFTINNNYINFQVGGGSTARPGDILNDFEGTTWGTGWTANGSFSGQAPSSESLTNQVGSKVADTFVGGGDSSTGAVSSPSFTINRDYLDFRIAGGNHPWGSGNPTAVVLIVDGAVVRSATGNNSATLSDVNWDLHTLIGQKATIEIVDHHSASDWGHIIVDQFVLSSSPDSIGGGADTSTTVNLIVGGQVVRTMTGQNSEQLTWASWEVSEFNGQSAQIQIVDNSTASWGHILVDQISQDARPATS